MMKSLLVVILLCCGSFVWAQDERPLFQILIKDHRFIPSTIKVPANAKFRLEVKNEDSTTEEFESASMNIEKFVGPKKTLKLVLGPLKPGKYNFFGEFHQDTAQGEIVAE